MIYNNNNKGCDEDGRNIQHTESRWQVKTGGC